MLTPTCHSIAMKSSESDLIVRKFEISISEDQAGTRLDRILASNPEFSSRSQVAQLFSSGSVLKGDKSLKASFIPKVGDCIVVLVSEPIPSQELEPLDFPLAILHEDQDVIVVNKPAGLVVHPSNGHKQDTLVNALIYHTNSLASGFQRHRPGIVHRLDKDTSGILVVAKNDRSHAFLAKQFREKTVHRIYWALVYGLPFPPAGTLRSHIGRHPNDRKKFASTDKNPQTSEPKGKLAVTHYRTLKTSPQGFSLIECRLETGRTHQIRVHLSELGHPIVGDPIYGGLQRAKGLKSPRLRSLIFNLGRISLCARELSFVHPSSKKLLAFQITWPEDLLDLYIQTGFDRV